MTSKAELAGEGAAQSVIVQASAPPAYQSTGPAPNVTSSGEDRGAPPPEYHTAVANDDPPPSYQQLYGEFRQVNDEREFLAFIKKISGIFCGSRAMHVGDCPIEPYIPIYLCVAGCFAVFKAILNYAYRAKAKHDSEQSGQQVDPETAVKPNPFDGLISAFLFGWFIAGSYWVYHAYYPDYTETSVNRHRYCDKTTYIFAFVLVTIQWLFIAASLFCCCCCGCWVFARKRRSGSGGGMNPNA